MTDVKTAFHLCANGVMLSLSFFFFFLSFFYFLFFYFKAFGEKKKENIYQIFVNTNKGILF